MSNGAQCCALEICCPPGDRSKLKPMIAQATGLDDASVDAMLAWMDSEDLVFAPASFQQVTADVMAIVRKHDAATT